MRLDRKIIEQKNCCCLVDQGINTVIIIINVTTHRRRISHHGLHFAPSASCLHVVGTYKYASIQLPQQSTVASAQSSLRLPSARTGVVVVLHHRERIVRSAAAASLLIQPQSKPFVNSIDRCDNGTGTCCTPSSCHRVQPCERCRVGNDRQQLNPTDSWPWSQCCRPRTTRSCAPPLSSHLEHGSHRGHESLSGQAAHGQCPIDPVGYETRLE